MSKTKPIPANDDYKRRTSFVHGEQTWGRAYSDLEKEFALDSGSPVNSKLNYIQETLDVFKITPKQLKNMTVLDIGTGRQAIQFQRLGAKQVSHFDIAPRHIEQTRDYCRRHKIRNVKSILGDLTRDRLPTKKFDLVFAAGIYQHIEVPSLGLINFAQSLKVGGKMYLGFYRSGDWRWFISALIRGGLQSRDFSDLKNKIAVSFSLGDAEHFQVARMLDDFFVPSMNCMHPKDIIEDSKTCGLETYYIEKDFRDYHHEGPGYFTVGGDRIYATKKKHRSYDALLKKNFKTSRGVDQLQGIDYKEPLIKDNIGLWLQLVNLHDYGFITDEAWRDILMNLYRFARPWEMKRDDYYIHATEAGRHQTLNIFLKNLFRVFGR